MLSFLLEQSHPVSRPEIALACDLSRPTVFAAIERLTDLDLVTDVGQRVGLPGRSASLYEVSDRAGVGIGVDIGGSNIRVALTDARGQVVAETRVATSASGGRAIARQVVSLVRRVTAGTALGAGVPTVVGVSVPGVIDPDGATVHYAWNIGQSGPFDLRTPLEKALRTQVVLDNNVNLAAVGEQWQGAAQHLRTFAVIAVGAGVGAGIVHEGQLLRGAHGAAGEVAFLPLSPDYQRRRAASPDEAGRPDPAGKGASPRRLAGQRTTDQRRGALRARRPGRGTGGRARRGGEPAHRRHRRLDLRGHRPGDDHPRRWRRRE